MNNGERVTASGKVLRDLSYLACLYDSYIDINYILFLHGFNFDEMVDFEYPVGYDEVGCFPF